MIRRGAQVLDSLDLWERHAGPKSNVQWQDDRSAKECARAWLPNSTGWVIPPEIVQVLQANDRFSEVLEWAGEPECHVAIDSFGGPANIDVMITARDRFGTFVVAVEAKADESFGPLLSQALSGAGWAVSTRGGNDK